MTFTSTRYENYAEYFEADLGLDGNFRLLSNGEIIKLPPGNEENSFIADEFAELLKRLLKNRRLVKSSSTELQIHPVGDSRVNKEPDLIVLRPEHPGLMAEIKKNAILFGMPAPLFVAEVVGTGSEGSANYRRDYEWKRQQYEWWEIPKYWIIDRHKQQVVVLKLIDGTYEEHCYRGSHILLSSVFPTLELSAEKLLAGKIF